MNSLKCRLDNLNNVVYSQLTVFLVGNTPRERWKWHLHDPKFQNFLGGMTPNPPCNLGLRHLLAQPPTIPHRPSPFQSSDSPVDNGELCTKELHRYTKEKKETGCDHKPPFFLYCRESCRVSHTLEKTWNFFHKKKLCYTVSMRIMGQTTARVAHVSSLSRDTTRACATSLGQMEQVTAWCSLHTALARNIDCYRPSYCWRFKEPLCGVTWKRATSNQEDKSDPYTPWDTPNRYYQRCP